MTPHKPKQEDPLVWCVNRLAQLVGLVGDLASIAPAAVYEQGPWTALKEIFLATYNSWIYSRIVPNFFRQWYYVDALCGPGLVRITGTADVIAGSPIIAAATARTPFTDMFLADSDSTSRDALVARLGRLREHGFTVVFDDPVPDCNELLQAVGRRLPATKSNFLAFVDLQGMEVEWAPFSAILSRLGDVIVTFNTAQIQRTWGRAREGEESYVLSMNRFYGGDAWESARVADDLPEIYLDLLSRSNRPNTLQVRIHRENPPLRQELLFAARETKGGSPWFDAVRNRIKPKVEAQTDESVARALDIMTGRQPTLDWFFNVSGQPHRKTLEEFNGADTVGKTDSASPQPQPQGRDHGLGR